MVTQSSALFLHANAGMLRDRMVSQSTIVWTSAAVLGIGAFFGGVPTRDATAQMIAAVSQDAELADRPIADIRMEGLSRVTRQEVLNNIRSAVGDPFNSDTIRGDVGRLNRLGQFKYVDAVGELKDDGTVVLIFEFVEQALIHEIQVVGNKRVTDQELLAVVRVVPRGPRDDFLIQNAKRAIEEVYRKRGNYLATVSIDEKELDESGILIFRIIEGPRVRVRAIEFEGNEAFADKQLHAEVKTSTAIFLFRRGELDEDVLVDDVAALDRFYKDRGYLDVRVDRTIDLSPDDAEAKVTFLVSEGQQYTLRSIRATTLAGGPLRVFAPQQLAAMLDLKEGSVYSRDLLRKSIKAVQDSYGLMGYLDVIVQPHELRVGNEPQVDLLLEINEGKRFVVGEVQINGNFLTRDKVIRRELRGITPGRPFDASEIERSEERLLTTRLFSGARITIQPEDPNYKGFRDVLVEVKERNTGSVNFGVAIGSDAGVFGEFSVIQRNFDVSDTPESLHELVTGRAFRGAGQRFNMSLRPGTELFQYAVSLTEPHIFDTNYSFTVGAHFRDRVFARYDEERLGANLQLGRQFGDIWTVGLHSRFEEISLDNFDPFAPTEVFLDAGPDVITSLGINLTRTTITTFRRPGEGSRFEFSLNRYGVFGGDFDFNSVGAEYTVYFTVDEDFLGQLSTIKFNSRLGYLFGGGRVPTYERLYLGGRTFRGFEFRSVSPKGIRADTLMPSDDPIGGEWLAFLGAQYEHPLMADAMTGVLFIDSGTVTADPSLDDWRVSVGAGIRLYIPQFGDVPIAFDFAVPLESLPDDDKQVFSFTAELPF